MSYYGNSHNADQKVIDHHINQLDNLLNNQNKKKPLQITKLGKSQTSSISSSLQSSQSVKELDQQLNQIRNKNNQPQINKNYQTQSSKCLQISGQIKLDKQKDIKQISSELNLRQNRSKQSLSASSSTYKLPQSSGKSVEDIEAELSQLYKKLNKFQ